MDSGRYRRAASICVKLLLLGIGLGIWEFAARHGWYKSVLAPPPSQLWHFAQEMIGRPETWGDISDSLRRVLTGFGCALMLSVFLAFVFNRLRRIRPFVEMWIDLARPIPPVAWIPIAILIWGIGDRPAYFIVFLSAFFPLFTNIAAGLNAVDRRHLDIARSFRASHYLVWTRVVFPTLLTYLLPGMRASIGVAWMSTVTSELIGAQSGLGYRMQLSRVTLETGNIILVMALIGIIGAGFNALLIAAERRLTPWRSPGGI